MASLDTMMNEWQRGPSGALCIFHQRFWRFPLCTHHHSLGPHTGTNRLHHFGLTIGSLSLGETRRFLMGSAIFEGSLDAISTTDLFDTFTKTLCVGYDNMTLTLHSMVGRLGTAFAPIINLSRRPLKAFLHLVQSTFGVVTLGESFPEVLLFFLKQLRIAAHGGVPVGEGLDDTKLRGDGGCPTVNTGLYVWVSCIQLWTENHQPLVLQ